jgi:hypothetical protein
MEQVPDFHNRGRKTNIILFCLCLTSLLLAGAVYTLANSLNNLRHRVYLLEHQGPLQECVKYL